MTDRYRMLGGIGYESATSAHTWQSRKYENAWYSVAVRSHGNPHCLAAAMRKTIHRSHRIVLQSLAFGNDLGGAATLRRSAVRQSQHMRSHWPRG